MSQFEIVHEKLMHVFVVSENLEYFAHVHPTLQSDGRFTLPLRFPYGGMYRMLADFYPAGAVPQLAVSTIFVAGRATPARLTPSLTPCRSTNLTATLRTEPEQLFAVWEQTNVFAQSCRRFADLSRRLGPYAGRQQRFDRSAAYPSVSGKPG